MQESNYDRKISEAEKNTDKPLPMITDLVLQGVCNKNMLPKSSEMDCEREPGEVSDSDAEETNEISTEIPS